MQQLKNTQYEKRVSAKTPRIYTQKEKDQEQFEFQGFQLNQPKPQTAQEISMKLRSSQGLLGKNSRASSPKKRDTLIQQQQQKLINTEGMFYLNNNIEDVFGNQPSIQVSEHQFEQQQQQFKKRNVQDQLYNIKNNQQKQIIDINTDKNNNKVIKVNYNTNTNNVYRPRSYSPNNRKSNINSNKQLQQQNSPSHNNYNYQKPTQSLLQRFKVQSPSEKLNNQYRYQQRNNFQEVEFQQQYDSPQQQNNLLSPSKENNNINQQQINLVNQQQQQNQQQFQLDQQSCLVLDYYTNILQEINNTKQEEEQKKKLKKQKSQYKKKESDQSEESNQLQNIHNNQQQSNRSSQLSEQSNSEQQLQQQKQEENNLEYDQQGQQQNNNQSSISSSSEDDENSSSNYNSNSDKDQEHIQLILKLINLMGDKKSPYQLTIQQVEFWLKNQMVIKDKKFNQSIQRYLKMNYDYYASVEYDCLNRKQRNEKKMRTDLFEKYYKITQNNQLNLMGAIKIMKQYFLDIEQYNNNNGANNFHPGGQNIDIMRHHGSQFNPSKFDNRFMKDIRTSFNQSQNNQFNSIFNYNPQIQMQVTGFFSRNLQMFNQKVDNQKLFMNTVSPNEKEDIYIDPFKETDLEEIEGKLISRIEDQRDTVKHYYKLQYEQEIKQLKKKIEDQNQEIKDQQELNNDQLAYISRLEEVNDNIRKSFEMLQQQFYKLEKKLDLQENEQIKKEREIDELNQQISCLNIFVKGLEEEKQKYEKMYNQKKNQFKYNSNNYNFLEMFQKNLKQSNQASNNDDQQDQQQEKQDNTDQVNIENIDQQKQLKFLNKRHNQKIDTKIKISHQQLQTSSTDSSNLTSMFNIQEQQQMLFQQQQKLESKRASMQINSSQNNDNNDQV